MVEGRRKSHTFRRVKVRIATGTVIHYERRRPGRAVCSSCRRILHSVPNLVPTQLRKLAKSSRRPERPFGGVLCSECTRNLFKERARA